MVQKEIAPNLSYHYWYLGVQGLELDEEADPWVLALSLAKSSKKTKLTTTINRKRYESNRFSRQNDRGCQ